MKYIGLTFLIVAIAALIVALGGWIGGTGGAIVALIVLIGIGIAYYSYTEKRDKCPYQK